MFSILGRSLYERISFQCHAHPLNLFMSSLDCSKLCRSIVWKMISLANWLPPALFVCFGFSPFVLFFHFRLSHFFANFLKSYINKSTTSTTLFQKCIQSSFLLITQFLFVITVCVSFFSFCLCFSFHVFFSKVFFCSKRSASLKTADLSSFAILSILSVALNSFSLFDVSSLYFSLSVGHFLSCLLYVTFFFISHFAFFSMYTLFWHYLALIVTILSTILPDDMDRSANCRLFSKKTTNKQISLSDGKNRNFVSLSSIKGVFMVQNCNKVQKPFVALLLWKLKKSLGLVNKL